MDKYMTFVFIAILISFSLGIYLGANIQWIIKNLK